MTVSVIVPCRNERHHIREFLDSLLAQELDADCEVEILVADGMSDDGTREILREISALHPNIRVADNPRRIVSTGLNAAIQASTGDLIIRMDAHTVYATDYIRECVRASASSEADNVGGPWVAKGKGLLGRAIASAFRVRFCTGGGKAHDADYEGEVDTVYLGCWPRSVFSKIGGFDPELVRNQDDEFNFRLKRAGGRVWQAPRIKSIYTPRASLKALFRQYMQYGFWKVAVMRKHRALASWRHMIPVMFVLANLFLLALAAFPTALRPYALAIWSGMLALYFAGAIAAAYGTARRDSWDLFPLLPVVFLTYHVAYGSGFLMGLLYWPFHTGESKSELFTGLSR
jgi:glycosyltransferase involved in cell wall biosynthesis